jgi:hypothetical protein
MSRRHLLLVAGVSVLALAACGGSGKRTTSRASDVVATAQSAAIPPSTTSTPTSQSTAISRSTTRTPATTSTPAAGAHQSANRKAAAAPVGAATHSTSSTTPAATTRAATRKPQSPVACMVKVGLQHVGPAAQAGTWQGTDPASRKPIYVDGPYKSAAAARQAVSTLAGVTQAAPGGVWEVSASLRGGTGPAVRRVAACLDGSNKGYSF